MDKIKITGGVRLKGKIEIGGAKNSALPLMAASLLMEGSVTLSNLPHLSDISTMANLLVHHGVRLNINACSDYKPGHDGRVMTLSAADIKDLTAPYEIVRKMRASALVLGPLLARFGTARVSLPGGCAIGTRPIDLHLAALEKMGAEITLNEGYVQANAKGGLKGAVIEFPKVTVGATENLLMAATLAKGTTVVKNAAMEPEVSDLANCLKRMGAKIEGIGTRVLTIEGVKNLNSVNYAVIPDRIEAGTYATAAAITGGDVELLGAKAEIMGATIDVLRQCGVEITETAHGIRVKRTGDLLPVEAETEAYPGFATDMQAQLIALMCVATGTSRITENIFENRFMHVPELTRMGADIRIDGNTAVVKGIDHLSGASLMATDLRASVSLVIAALAARGTSIINRVYHLDRGYERLEEKLRGCGAIIERTNKE